MNPELSVSMRHKENTTEVNKEKYFREVYCDVLGPLNLNSLQGNKYVVHFTEVRSKYRWIYFVKHKSEVLDKIKSFVGEVKAMGFNMGQLRTDCGSEFVNEGVKEFASGSFILRTTPPNTQQSNGIAERFNRTLVEKTRAMLIGKKVPKFLWQNAMETTVYLNNRILNDNDEMTPFQQIYGRKPNIHHLRIFGSCAYAYNFDQRLKKLDSKGRKGILVGYDLESASYKIYLPNERKVIRSIHAVIDENATSDEIENELEEYDLLEGDSQNEDSQRIGDENSQPIDQRDSAMTQDAQESNSKLSTENESPSGTTTVEVNDEGDELTPEGDDSEDEVYSSRPRRNVKRIDYKELLKGNISSIKPKIFSIRKSIRKSMKINIPKDVNEAMNCIFSEEWKEAIQSELSSLYGHETWEVYQGEMEKINIISTKWIFTVKKDYRGNIIRFKARLVARGFEQEFGIDFEEVFSPVLKHNSLRMLMAMAAALDLEIQQVDVRTAFLHGELTEDVYIYPPEGTNYPEGTILKLKKALYGIKQAPRVFNQTLIDHLLSLGFSQSIKDPCILFKEKDDDRRIIISIYVDDMLLFGSNDQLLNELKRLIEEKFELDDRGEVDFILGIKVTRDRSCRTIKLDQARFTSELISKLGMNNSVCNNGSPFSDGYSIFTSVEDGKEWKMESFSFSMAVGSLLHLSTCTRPDIAYAVSNLGSFMSDPNPNHWSGLRHIVSYLNETRDRGIKFGPVQRSKLNQVEIYCDSDYAGDTTTRRSRTGFLAMMNGGPIAWKSHLQTRVSLSSTEAEYYAASEGCIESLWFKQVLDEIGLPQHTTTIYEDNTSCINLANNPIADNRTKHIEVKHHHLRQCVREKLVKMEKINSSSQLADVFTKNVTGERFRELTNQIMTQKKLKLKRRYVPKEI